MTHLATWITGGISAVAAAAAVWFAARADRAQRTAVMAQREATAAAREAAESADRAQRIQIRPALRIALDEQCGANPNGTPSILTLSVRNVGHGTAVIDRVKLFQFGNLSLDYNETYGFEQKLSEQFEAAIFVPLAGLPLSGAAAGLMLPPLRDSTRALEVGATRELFGLRIGTPAASRIVARFHAGLTAHVVYRSLAGDEFSTDQQFADLREARSSGRASTRSLAAS